MTNNTPAPADLVEAELHWPEGKRFTFHDDGGHNPCYIVMPDGAAIPLNHWDDETTDIARAKWIIAACNAALDQAYIASEGLTPKTDDDSGSLETIIKTADRLARRMGGRFVVKGKPADLVEAVARILPIRVHNGPDYAEVTFGDGTSHSSQAMTMNPEAWEAIESAHRRAAAITSQPDPRDAEIQRLRGEVEKLRKSMIPQWFYADGYSSEECHDSPDEVIEYLDLKPGKHVVKVDCASPLPSIWCAVHIRTEQEMDALDTDDCVEFTEHYSEDEARAALAKSGGL